MAAQIRAHKWTATPIGRADDWPSSLLTVVAMMLASPLVSSVAIGPERVLLYNDTAAVVRRPASWCAEAIPSVAEAFRDRAIPFMFATGYDRWALPSAYAEVPRCDKPFDAGTCIRTLFGSRT